MRIEFFAFQAVLFALLAGCVSSVPETLKLQRSQPFELSDVDQDGVIDARDICAQSSAYAGIDVQGCAEWSWKEYRELYQVFFDFDRSVIRNDQTQVLEAIIQDVLSAPGSEVAIIGDTSEEGSLDYNQKLGARRANAIASVLIERGVPREMIRSYEFSDELVRHRLFKRQRRTMVQVSRPSQYNAEEMWDIYRAENAQDERATDKVIK